MTVEDPNRGPEGNTPITIEIPPEVQARIATEIEADLAYLEEPLDEDDKDMLETQKAMLRVTKETAYKVYTWFNGQLNSKQVLYYDAGQTDIPRAAFQDNHVVYYTLKEEDREEIPPENHFDIVLLDNLTDIDKVRKAQATLKEGGVLITSQVLDFWDESQGDIAQLFPGWERSPIPQELQGKDEARYIDFYGFTKPKSSQEEPASPLTPEVPNARRVPYIEHEMPKDPIPPIEKVAPNFLKKYEAKKKKRPTDEELANHQSDVEALKAILTPEGIQALAEKRLQMKLASLESDTVDAHYRLDGLLVLKKVRDGMEIMDEVVDGFGLWVGIKDIGQTYALDRYGQLLDVDLIGIGQEIKEKVQAEELKEYSMVVATNNPAYVVKVFYDDKKLKYDLKKVVDTLR